MEGEALNAVVVSMADPDVQAQLVDRDEGGILNRQPTLSLQEFLQLRTKSVV